MRGTTPFGQRTPLILMSVVVLLTITVGMVVYQVIGREDSLPGSAGGVGEPAGDQGVQIPDDPIAAWASDAAIGDYAGARQFMEPDEFFFAHWKRRHERFANKITGYTILERKTVGQTTTAVVRFQFPANDATCIELMLDEGTQRIRVENAYYPCPMQ